MSDDELLTRISIDPKVMVGKPVIKGTRLTVEYIVRRLAKGSGIPDLLDEYKGLQSEDIQACLVYAARNLSASEVLPLSPVDA